MARILIVDDDPDALELAATLAEDDGHDVLSCRSAEEAQALTKQTGPDLAIIDICLPDENGMRLAYRMRLRFPRMPILVLSGKLDEWDEEDILDCGVDRAMAKPYKPEAFRRTLGELLRSGRVLANAGE